MQIPIVRIPLLFLSTWAHEFGHGMGAIITGGRFMKLTLYPNFSGVAMTATVHDWQRVVVVAGGLIGPAVLGATMVFLTRGLNAYRIALSLICLMALLSQIWAGDMFTRLTLAGLALILMTIIWKLPNHFAIYVSSILAIAISLTALTGFGYFFMGNAEVAGQLYRSDTGVLDDLLPGPYWFWGAVLALLSILLLLGSVWGSDRLARRASSARRR